MNQINFDLKPMYLKQKLNRFVKTRTPNIQNNITTVSIEIDSKIMAAILCSQGAPVVLARMEDHVSTFTTVTTDTLAPVLLDSLELSVK